MKGEEYLRKNMKRLIIIMMSILCAVALGASAGVALADNEEKVIFVSGVGRDSNSGESDDQPKATIHEAIRAIGDADGTIVICGDYTHRKNDEWFPVHKGQIKITSSYGSKNYLPIFRVESDIYLGGKTIIENISIQFSDQRSIFCNGYDTIFGKGITVSHGRQTPPNIYGGKDCTKGNFVLTSFSLRIDSGSWGKVYCGNYRNKASDSLSRLPGDTVLMINGGTFLDTVAATGSENRAGDAKLIINGGEFRCSVLGIAEPSVAYGSKLTVKGNIDMELNGGVFSGDIAVAARNEETSLNGKCDIRLGAGDFSRVNLIQGAEGTLLYSEGKATATLHISEGIDINAQQTGDIVFKNNIANFADPSVLYHDGWYYYTYAKDYMGKPAVWIRRSPNFSDISASRPVLVWAEAINPSGMSSLWAPQLVVLEGKYYLYATCAYKGTDNENGVTPRKPVVFVSNVSDDALGGYTYYGPMDNTDPDVLMYLSPRFIQWQDKTYMINGGFFRSEDRMPDKYHYQSLFVTEMESPTSFKGKAVKIAEATRSWEISNNGKCEILEGPFAYTQAKDGKLYVLYSANETATDNYCTGLLRFDGSATDDITNASLWYKFPDPIQQKDTSLKMYSPGAMVLTTSPDGEQIWMLFHIKTKSGYTYDGRIMCAQPLITDENGVPQESPLQALSTEFSYKKNTMPLVERIKGFNDQKTFVFVPPVIEDYDNDATVDTTPAPAEPAPSQSNGNAMPWIIAGAAAAVLAVGGVVAAVIAKKKKS